MRHVLNFLVLTTTLLCTLYGSVLLADSIQTPSQIVARSKKVIISQVFFVEQPTSPPTNGCIVITNAQEIEQLALSIKLVTPLVSDELFSYGSPVFFFYEENSGKRPKSIMALYGDCLCWNGFPNGNARLTADSYTHIKDWIKKTFAKHGIKLQRTGSDSSRESIGPVTDPFDKGMEIQSTNTMWNSNIDPFS